MTTSENGNAGVELTISGYALLGVSCPKGIDGSKGVICIPYTYSPVYGTYGFHAMSEEAPFDAVKSTELTVDVFYRKL